MLKTVIVMGVSRDVFLNDTIHDSIDMLIEMMELTTRPGVEDVNIVLCFCAKDDAGCT